MAPSKQDHYSYLKKKGFFLLLPIPNIFQLLPQPYFSYVTQFSDIKEKNIFSFLTILSSNTNNFQTKNPISFHNSNLKVLSIFKNVFYKIY